MTRTTKYLLRLPLFTLPLLLTGALDQCDVIPECPAVLLDCADGEIAVDTDDDGCEDACEPITTCQAFPACDPGDTEVADSSGCLQDDATCYSREACGYTIWCTGETDPEPELCLSDDECGAGERCDFTSGCEQPSSDGDARPEDDAAQIACWGRCMPQNICAALLCDEGEVPVDTDGDGCMDTCEGPPACLALPTCQPGDFEVDGPGSCLQDDATCYSLTVCGTTIWCTGEAAVSCWDSSECGQNQYCDMDNYCESACEDENLDCLAVCLGRCVDRPICAAIECADNEYPVDENGDGCMDVCMGNDAPPVCPAIYVDCVEPNTVPSDTDGDGCIDGCIEVPTSCQAIECAHPVDTDGDGCPDECAA